MTARPAPIRRDLDVTAIPRTQDLTLDNLAAVINAVPHIAAIVRLRNDGLELVAGNHRYHRFLEIRRDEMGANYDVELNEWVGHVREVAEGRPHERLFDLDYTALLGTSTYRGSLSRVTGIPGESSLVLFTAIDRTDESRIEKVLRRELLTDMLTALPNRAGFLDQAEQRQFMPGDGHAIITVDLVRFSRINESLGSIAGDEIIITVARRIKSVLRAGDVLGRIGGNEFAIHSVAVRTLEDARQIAGRVQSALEAPIRISSYLINVEAAVGCAIGTAEDGDTEELFRSAQVAVKRSKQTGKLEIYRPSALHEAQERFTLESRLREALQANALHLEFQPFVSLANGEVVGFEALARWTDAELGAVPPTKFIPVAEESGLILPLGRWALAESARWLAEWDRDHGSEVPLTINVNLSAMQIARDDVAGAVHDALDAAHIDGRRLTIEITESALISDITKARQLLAALKAMQINIAMDDFGTGFSNLANLQTLPIDVLKIDRSFVNGMVGDRDKIAIVRAILSLAGALGMKTVAEGIETAEVGRALADLGCDRGQGFYYAKPMRPDAAFVFWRERYRPNS